MVIHHLEGLLVVALHSLETTIARAPRTRPFHGVLPHREAEVEAADHNEEDSHVDHVVVVAAAAEAAGGKKGVLPLRNQATYFGESQQTAGSTIPLSLG